jgi:fermentation-respiration switch protein FrsA (DUF1100 family)
MDIVIQDLDDSQRFEHALFSEKTGVELFLFQFGLNKDKPFWIYYLINIGKRYSYLALKLHETKICSRF